MDDLWPPVVLTMYVICNRLVEYIPNTLLQVVDIWDARTGGLLGTLRGHRDRVQSVTFTPDGRGLVSGSLDKTMKYWDVSSLAGGPGGLPNSQWASERGTLDGSQGVGTRESNSPCTMDFIGHKVRVELADQGCV